MLWNLLILLTLRTNITVVKKIPCTESGQKCGMAVPVLLYLHISGSSPDSNYNPVHVSVGRGRGQGMLQLLGFLPPTVDWVFGSWPSASSCPGYCRLWRSEPTEGDSLFISLSKNKYTHKQINVKHANL